MAWGNFRTQSLTVLVTVLQKKHIYEERPLMMMEAEKTQNLQSANRRNRMANGAVPVQSQEAPDPRKAKISVQI